MGLPQGLAADVREWLRADELRAGELRAGELRAGELRAGIGLNSGPGR